MMLLAIATLLWEGTASVPPSHWKVIDIPVNEAGSEIRCRFEVRRASNIQAQIVTGKDAERFSRGQSFSALAATGFDREGTPSGTDSGAPPVPDREPDYVVSQATLPQQALLYRLCGDRNPLHADPAFARAGGFDRPILHGLCTYGFAGRALLHTLCGSDPARFAGMSGRFTRPVLPGQTLTTRIWVEAPTDARFQTLTDDGTVVIDRGRCTTR